MRFFFSVNNRVIFVFLLSKFFFVNKNNDNNLNYNKVSIKNIFWNNGIFFLISKLNY